MTANNDEQVGTCTLELPPLNNGQPWGGVIPPTPDFNGLAKSVVDELEKYKGEVVELEKELASSKSTASFNQGQLSKLGKEIKDLHDLLDTFNNTMKPEDQWASRPPLAIRLTSFLTKEFTWKGDK